MITIRGEVVPLKTDRYRGEAWTALENYAVIGKFLRDIAWKPSR